MKKSMFFTKGRLLAVICAALPVTLAAQTQQPPAIRSLDLTAIDRASNPCDNFYQYACGNWIRNNPIPPDQSRWGRFNELADRNLATLREILDHAADASHPRSPSIQKIGDLYGSCMDDKAVEAQGISPIEPTLERIAKLQNKSELAAEVARLHDEAVPVLFRLGSGPDAKNSSEVIAQLTQGGLTLPDRDYYLKTDPRSRELRDKYVAHVTRMFELLGSDPRNAAAQAQSVLAIETALAKVSLDRVALRDPDARYHREPVSALSTLAPGFNWKTYLAGRAVSVSDLNISVPDFIRGLNGVLDSASLDDLKTYFSWHVLNKEAELLPAKFVDEDFDFNERTLLGAKEIQPRWKRCVRLVDGDLGEALGREYVEKTFGAEGKERTLRMVHEIEAEMAKDIQNVPWMSDATKKQAVEKLHAVANKIGYPEKWRDYSSVKIVRGELVADDRRTDEFNVRHMMDKIGKPLDKLEWTMTPPTVNAYYSPPMNNINFPAGILQPPFYFKGGDEAANYGAIGAVVGHELTHGFDDQGRKFDGQGDLRDWWTAGDASNFKERADCIVNEYGNFTASGDTKLNGRLTLGENAADNGGVRLAFMALLDSMGAHALPQIDGYTPQQRFFLAYAQIWCENITDQAARNRALTDPHSLGRYRVNGVLQNMPEFEQTFGCKTGDQMVSPNACRVW